MDLRRKALEQVDVVEGTAEWFHVTDEVKAWESQDVPAKRLPLLVLEGKPGSGKSIVMQRSFAQAKSRRPPSSIYIGYFFDATNGDLTSQKPSQYLYRSILFQLLYQLPPSPIITKLVKSWTESADGYEYIIILKERILQLLAQAQNQEVVVYIDALDECAEPGKSENEAAIDVLHFLEKMWETCKLVRVCLSMRESKMLGTDLEPTQLLRADQRNDHDIHKYLLKHLKPPAGSPEFRADLHRKLLRRSSNMFQWVRLVVRSINELGQGTMEEEIDSEVNRLPGQLKDLYATLLGKLDAKTRDEALALLQIVHVAVRPLKVAEIRSALEYHRGSDDVPSRYDATSTKGFDDRIVRICRGLAEIRTRRVRQLRSGRAMQDRNGAVWEEEVVVQLTHQSVREFLEQSRWEELSVKNSSELIAQAHIRTAEICMRAVKDGESEFMSYATQFWTLHARKGDEAMDNDFNPPPFVMRCSLRTKDTIDKWKACVAKNTLRSVGVDKNDFTNTRILRREESSLLALLAFEGCAGLISKHSTTCQKPDTCYGNASVLEVAIFLAANRGWPKVITAIADIAEQRSLKIDLNKAYPHTKQPPLFTACFFNRVETVKVLLGLGCDVVDQTNKPPSHPFHLAVEHGYNEIVTEFLRSSETSIEFWFTATDLRGHTLLHLAAGRGRWIIFNKVLTELLGLEENPERVLGLKSGASMTAYDMAVAGRKKILETPRRDASLQDYDQIIAELERYGCPRGPSHGLHGEGEENQRLSLPHFLLLRQPFRRPLTPLHTRRWHQPP